MRQLKRMDSASKSPMFSHFSETLTGVSTIRAYKMQGDFVRTMQGHVDENLLYYFPNNISNRWLALRLELVKIIFRKKKFYFLPFWVVNWSGSGLLNYCFMVYLTLKTVPDFLEVNMFKIIRF
jgi:hypothetical protein